MRIPSALVTTVLGAFLVPVCFGLECYICTNQDENNAKCTSTIQLCEPHQDRCMTEVRWGSTPYWAPTGEKQFYVSKWCSNQTVCEYTIRRQSKRCDRIWYNDWECSECCTGDRCNYYVTLGASGLKSSMHLLLGFAVLALVIRRS
ncbi:uncharacterized protein LOC100901649 [Galendromus occidentalis]|uniref:Uncharacterized protein LOC100901649 n=1 Tax=Galendromus occidentalis TaxID=34638 RepID=A0AAJ6VZH1_9ACAR|nr:uncharacterized protein LOC100901649 [Galendromus occidentalis]